MNNYMIISYIYVILHNNVCSRLILLYLSYKHWDNTGNHTKPIIKAGISVSMFTAFLPLFKSHQDGKYKQINVRVNYNDLKSDIYSLFNDKLYNGKSF